MLNRFKFRVMPADRAYPQNTPAERDMRDREEAFYRLLVAEKKKLKEREEND